MFSSYTKDILEKLLITLTYLSFCEEIVKRLSLIPIEIGNIFLHISSIFSYFSNESMNCRELQAPHRLNMHFMLTGYLSV